MVAESHKLDNKKNISHVIFEDFLVRGPFKKESNTMMCKEFLPKKVIFAEILAAGFQLQDSIIQKGLEFDCKCGISGRLMYYLHQLQDNLKALDDQYKVYDKVSATAVQLDTKFAVQDKIKYVTTQAQDKVNQAIETPAGKIMLEYYLSTTKQVADVHAEARRIADEKQVKLIPSHEEESTNGSL
ncbi:8187_t:CDS:2 [Entrophospora sp. SA101]|nr:8187_t:CDS:2 [Entrophospora sp. SA101]